MAADRERVTDPDLLGAPPGQVTHRLIEEGPQPEHISDDGLSGLCGESLIVDHPAGPPCLACQERAAVARYVWPRIGPAMFVLLWLTAITLGRYVADQSVRSRDLAVLGSTLAILALVALAGRVRPTQGGDQQS